MIGWLLLERVGGLRACSSSAVNIIRVANISLRSSSTNSSRFDRNPNDDFKNRNKREDDRKKRKRYALGGCLITVFFSTHAILLWRRRNEFRKLNKIMPAINWDKFADEYLIQGRVKSIVYQPHFHTGDAYLHCDEEVERQKLEQHFLSTFRAGPEKFTRTPDIRFTFDGDSDALESAIEKALADGKKSCDVHLEINRFPSYRELIFIFMSILFALAATGFMKF